jgi:hypothetical protein
VFVGHGFVFDEKCRVILESALAGFEREFLTTMGAKRTWTNSLYIQKNSSNGTDFHGLYADQSEFAWHLTVGD